MAIICTGTYLDVAGLVCVDDPLPTEDEVDNLITEPDRREVEKSNGENSENFEMAEAYDQGRKGLPKINDVR